MRKRTFSLLAGAVFALGATQLCSASDRVELLISGPVESVQVASGFLTVMNHRVFARDMPAISVGSIVNVYGRLGKNGVISGAVVEDLARYGSGSESVFLKGQVSAVSVSTGHLVIGNSTVDYAALLSNSTFRLPALGDTVEISGTQPANRGVILASGVTSLTRIAGVVSTGDKLGVVSTGNALGVVSTGDKLGVVSTGNKLGVVSTSSAL